MLENDHTFNLADSLHWTHGMTAALLLGMNATKPAMVPVATVIRIIVQPGAFEALKARRAAAGK